MVLPPQAAPTTLPPQAVPTVEPIAGGSAAVVEAEATAPSGPPVVVAGVVVPGIGALFGAFRRRWRRLVCEGRSA